MPPVLCLVQLTQVTLPAFSFRSVAVVTEQYVRRGEAVNRAFFFRGAGTADLTPLPYLVMIAPTILRDAPWVIGLGCPAGLHPKKRNFTGMIVFSNHGWDSLPF